MGPIPDARSVFRQLRPVQLAKGADGSQNWARIGPIWGMPVNVTVKVAEKKPENHRVFLDCQGVNQRGEIVITGSAKVISPKRFPGQGLSCPRWNCAKRAV